MTVESALGFAMAMFILAITPGPGVFASVSQALASGFRSSIPVIGGIVVGDLVFLLLAVFGLSAVAHVLGDLFFIVRLLGGGYLIWLGWKMWTIKPVPYGSDPDVESRNGWQRFTGGLLVTLSNPKVILFYAGFLPTFMDLTILKPIDVSIVSGLVVLILSGIMAMYSFSASRARKLFTSCRALRNLNRSAGTVMIGTGLMIATR